MSGLLPLEDAQQRLLALASPVAIEKLPVETAVGRYLAEPLMALRSQPAVPLSAMDGYAIRFADREGPWTVAGECRAGAPPCAPMRPGEAARIFTGASLPKGADSVLIQENVERDGDTLRLTGEAVAHVGRNVRPAGSDFAQSTSLLPAGAAINAPAIGLSISAGHAMLPVRRRVRVALLSTGDELRPAGEACADHQIPASCAPMIAAMLGDLPCDVSLPPSLPDKKGAIAEALGAHRDFDIIATIGGASVGDHDLVQPALREMGADLNFWKVAIRPGKPVFAGTAGDTVILGLPGNPVSAYVAALLFLMPLIRHMAGASDLFAKMLQAPLTVDLPANGPREHYMRAQFVDGGIAPLHDQDSASLTRLASADALIRRPAKAGDAAAGTMVDYIAM